MNCPDVIAAQTVRVIGIGFVMKKKRLKKIKEIVMSRSYRKTPIFGHACADSEKEDKRQANRSFRRTSKTLLASGKEPLHDVNQASEVWAMAKDGKSYWPDALAEDMRK